MTPADNAPGIARFTPRRSGGTPTPDRLGLAVGLPIEGLTDRRRGRLGLDERAAAGAGEGGRALDLAAGDDGLGVLAGALDVPVALARLPAEGADGRGAVTRAGLRRGRARNPCGGRGGLRCRPALHARTARSALGAGAEVEAGREADLRNLQAIPHPAKGAEAIAQPGRFRRGPSTTAQPGCARPVG